MQQRNLILLFTFSSMLVAVSAAVCGGCMDNKVACLNETHYKFCINNVAIDGVLSCGTGKICTSLFDPCWRSVEGDGVEPVCKASDVNCRSCDGSSLFVCTSRTTFQMCDDSVQSTQITCPANTYCSIDSGEICVRSCKLLNGKYECDKEAP